MSVGLMDFFNFHRSRSHLGATKRRGMQLSPDHQSEVVIRRPMYQFSGKLYYTALLEGPAKDFNEMTREHVCRHTFRVRLLLGKLQLLVATESSRRISVRYTYNEDVGSSENPGSRSDYIVTDLALSLKLA